MKLNLGCGEDMREGFVNVDLRDLTAPPGVKFIQAEVRQYLRSLDDGSVEYIHLQDIIEHFVKDESLVLLREAFRVLRKGGDLFLRAPDGLWLAKRLVNPDPGMEIDPELYSWLVMGAQTYEGNYHYTLWTPDWMTQELLGIGYEVTDLSTGTAEDNNFVMLARRPM